MATVVICDKCKKIIKTDEDRWTHEKSYDYCPKKVVKIKTDVISLEIKIVRRNGEILDLCNRCAIKIINIKTG